MKVKFLRKLANEYFFESVEDKKKFSFTSLRKLNLKVGQVIEINPV